MKKRLEINNDDTFICGVCSGITRYYNIDTIIIRIIFLILLFYTSLPMVIIYLILSVLIPESKTKGDV